MDTLAKTRRILLITQLTIFGCAVIVYLNSLGNQFALDDHIHIVTSPKIRSLEQAFSAFWSGMFPGNLYRPLVVLSYAGTYALFGLNPLPYHLTNILLHALNSVLVFRLLFLFSNLRVAALVALFFAIVPSGTEVVANISGRSELLSAFFLLNTLVLATGEGLWSTGKLNTQRALSIFASFLCALFSKESAVVAPLLFLICISARRFSWIDRRAIITLLAIFGSALVIYLTLRANALGGLFGQGIHIDFLDNPLIALPWNERLLGTFSLLGRYLILPLSVDPLSADYSFAFMQPTLLSDWRAYFELFLALIIAVAAFTKRTTPAILWFASAWFLGAFLVTSNIFFPIGTIFAERLAYLPNIGAILIMIWGLDRLKAAPALEIFTFLIISVRAITLTSIRNQEWRDDERLYTKQIQVSPQSAKTQLNYGVVLREKGDQEGAERRFRAALEIYPQFADAYFNLGLTSALKGDEKAGAEFLKKAIELNPAHIPAIDTLGRYYLRDGEFVNAKQQFERALKLDPQYFSARIGLLAALVNLKETAEARALYEALVKIDPENIELVPFRKIFGF